MKIEVEPKFGIGDIVYCLKIENYTAFNHNSLFERKGYIYKCQIQSIRFYEKDKYQYEIWNDKYVDEAQLYKKLADAQQAAIERGYTVKGKYADIKYIS